MNDEVIWQRSDFRNPPQVVVHQWPNANLMHKMKAGGFGITKQGRQYFRESIHRKTPISLKNPSSNLYVMSNTVVKSLDRSTCYLLYSSGLRGILNNPISILLRMLGHHFGQSRVF